MKCKDVMQTAVQLVSPLASIQGAAAMMRELHVGFLPVCEEGLRVVGVLSLGSKSCRGIDRYVLAHRAREWLDAAIGEECAAGAHED